MDLAPPLLLYNLSLPTNDHCSFIIKFIKQKLKESDEVECSNEKRRAQIAFELFDYISNSHIFDYECLQTGFRQVVWEKLIEFYNDPKGDDYNFKGWIPKIVKKMF